MEMVQAWEAGGSVRKELLKKWWSNPSVATVTAEILFSELHLEPGAQILHVYPRIKFHESLIYFHCSHQLCLSEICHRTLLPKLLEQLLDHRI